MIVDTHAHLTDAKLAHEAAEIVARARLAGVDWLVTIASDIADSHQAIQLAHSLDGVYATVGVHPHAAGDAPTDAISQLRTLAADDRVVAIGETGLDFHYDNAPRPVQVELFRAQIELAAERDLPVVVHAREADEEVGQLILEMGWRRGVLHCFSGGSRLLEIALSIDWHISFAGMITFPRWEGAEQLRQVPLERLLVETDSPYLAPVPHRGKRNEPAHVRLVVDKAAEIRGEPVDVLAAATTRNAARFYGVNR